jgi:hypothetical protein
MKVTLSAEARMFISFSHLPLLLPKSRPGTTHEALRPTVMTDWLTAARQQPHV